MDFLYLLIVFTMIWSEHIYQVLKSQPTFDADKVVSLKAVG